MSYVLTMLWVGYLIECIFCFMKRGGLQVWAFGGSENLCSCNKLISSVFFSESHYSLKFIYKVDNLMQYICW